MPNAGWKAPLKFTRRNEALSKGLPPCHWVRRAFTGARASWVFVMMLATVVLGPTGLCAQCRASAATAARPGPDWVVFPDGEKLLGHFEGLIGGVAKFKSDQAGEITIDLGKIQELSSAHRFAVVKKGVKLTKGETDGKIPHGTISIANHNITVDPGNGQAAQTMPVGDASDIVDEATFLRAFQSPGIFHDWKGAIAVGASLVEATRRTARASTRP